MKQPENNEIDSLLRSWAGRRRSVSAGLAGNGAGTHLDVDELSSYAEGALPPETRARYTAHLADCDDCRHLVTQLAVAAGPIAREEPASQSSERASWLKALAAIFTPPVLRFALPALLLVAVGVVFLTSRRADERASVAMQTQPEKTQSESQPAAPAESTPANKPNSFNDSVAKAPAKETTSAEPQPSVAGAVAGNKSFEEDQKKLETKSETTAAEDKADLSKQGPKKEPVAAEKERNEVAQPATAAPPPAPKVAISGATKDGGERTAEFDAAKNADTRKREVDRSVNDVAASRPQSAGRDDDRQKAKAMRGARPGDARDDESATRSIAGRHFQQRDGAWVDMAYKSSMSTVNVTRGSEQYRALVADEPQIDAIAKQLGGEVFVVWKSRAYHIK